MQNTPDDTSEGPKDEQKQVKSWQNKIDAADKAYKKWEETYNCKNLEGYYSGAGHWAEPHPDQYTINLCHSSLEQRLPSILFNRPKFVVKPRPSRADDEMTMIEERVRLREDTLNTFLDDAQVSFMPETKLALKEAHYRFGVVEVGYDADVVDNPNVGKPAIDDEGKEMLKAGGEPVLQPDMLVEAESMWVRRIPASTFRAPVTANNTLRRNEWVGYFEWVYIEDLLKNRAYSNLDKIKPTGKMRRDFEASDLPDDLDEKSARQGMVKVWKVWSIREKKKYVWQDGKKFWLLPGEPFTTLPLAFVKFYDLLDELYPVPIMYNWTSVQDELNETRTGMKIHRKRFSRRYQVVEGKVKAEELEKLKSTEDGTLIFVPMLGLIAPIEDAPLDRALFANVPMTKEDMMYVTEVTGEQHGVSEADTATQANIIDVNTRIRQTQAREVVGKWLGEICYIMLRLIEERMALPMWIMKNVDPLAPMAMAEAARVAAAWEQIKAEQLGPLEFDIVVDMETLSPVTEDLRRNQWEKTLGMLANPGIAMLLASSPAILKRTLAFNGIRGDAEIKEITQALIVTGLAMASAKSGLPPGPGGSPNAPGGQGGEGPGVAGPPTASQMESAT